jgi:predicted tellurium resistance membrane protein TerC
MSTVAKPQAPGAPAPKPTPAPAKGPSKYAQPKKEFTLLFGRENYLMMAGGVLLIFIGFMMMSGGKSPDPHKFNYDEIYSFRRITLSPIVILLGFVLEVVAIMRKPKDTAQDTAGQ